MVVVSFVFDCEVVVLGLVDFFVIFNIFYFEGVWFLGQYVVYIIVFQLVIIGCVFKFFDIIGLFFVIVK